jgi:hypothetical protein
MKYLTVGTVLTLGYILDISHTFSQQAYYPLAVGNVWQYTDALHQIRAIGDTTLPDGHSYRILLDTWYNIRDFQRQQGDSIFQEGALLYDFSRLPGDTIVWNPGGYICVLLSIDTAEVLGRLLRRWTFGRAWGQFTGEVDVVTDSLGLTTVTNLEPPTQRVLTGARIDGRNYGSIMQVKNNSDLNLPAHMVLMQNYPNPFNPSTTISFSLPRTENITLKVYDLLGREVATLVEGRKEAGEHSVKWNAESFASGVYFCRLKAGDFVQTRKLVLVR